MSDPDNQAATVADYSQFTARDYFQTYYSEVVLPDEKVVLRYQLDVLARAGEKFGRGLEYGCGPTLHRAIAAAQHVFRLDMADWLADNLEHVREWLGSDGQSRDWNRFTRYVLDCEGRDPTAARIARREALTRKVVRGLHVSDARWRHPLGPEREAFYDMLISGFCVDAVSSSKHVWRRCMRNMLSTLAPGGLLVLHSLHRCSAYKVGDRMFPCADVSTDDMRNSLLDNGFAAGSIDVQVIPTPANAVYGYSGILVASGRKKR